MKVKQNHMEICETLIAWDIFNSDIIFHCKSENKQVQNNKTKRDICKPDSISPY